MNLLCGMCGKVHTDHYEFLICLKAHGGEHRASAEQRTTRTGKRMALEDTRNISEAVRPDVYKIFDY